MNSTVTSRGPVCIAAKVTERADFDFCSISKNAPSEPPAAKTGLEEHHYIKTRLEKKIINKIPNFCFVHS